MNEIRPHSLMSSHINLIIYTRCIQVELHVYDILKQISLEGGQHVLRAITIVTKMTSH